MRFPFAAGTVIPAVIKYQDFFVGSVSLRLNSYLRTGELGYWIDAHLEGKGAVSRACRALPEQADSAGMVRVKIRTATGNRKSAAVAERLGFALEGVLRSALPVGGARMDVALSARVQAGRATPPEDALRDG